MADSDVEIVVNERVEGDAIEKVASASKDAAENAKELIKLINSLSQTLEGINGDAAGQLRNELNELAEIIKEMDLSKLQSLDGILDKIKDTKVKLTPEGVVQVEEQLTAVEKKTKEVKKQFERLELNVGVESSGDKDSDFERKLEAFSNAEGLVSAIAEYRNKLNEIPGDYDEIIKKLDALENEAKNAGPETMDKFKAATEDVTVAFDKLGAAGKTAVAGIQQQINSTSQSLQNNIRAPIREIEGTTTETFSGANAMTAILHGNFQSLGSQLMGLLKKTKMWTGALGQGGAGAAKMVGGAFAFAMYGINKGIAATQNLLAGLREKARAAEQRHWNNEFSSGESANMTMKILGWKRDADANRKTEVDAEVAKQRAIRDAQMDVDDARIEADKQRSLAGNFNAGSVADIERRYEDTMADRGMDREQTAINDKMEDISRRKSELERDLGHLRQARKDVNAEAKSAADALQRAIKNGEDLDSYGSNVWQNIVDMVGGRSQEEVMADAQKYIEQGQSVVELINNYQEQLKKEINARESEIKAVNSELQGARAAQKTLAAKRGLEDERRKARDMRIQHEIAMENHSRDREVDVWERGERDQDEERDYSRRSELSSYQERFAAAEARRKAREQEEDRIWREYNALFNKNKGKSERYWSEEDKVRRSELEQDIDRARGRTRAAEDETYRLKRDGDSAGYGRRRDYEVERREEMEADRQMQRSWRTRRLGAAGRELDAKSEVNYQQKLLNERKKKLNDFIAARKKENGGRFSIEAMTEQQRAEFGNLRADYRESKGNVRSAKGAYMDVLWEGNQRAVDFRNGLKESNRLTSMGLAGGGTMKWGVDTASNTKEMVRLQRELNKRLTDERNGLATGSATYGY